MKNTSKMKKFVTILLAVSLLVGALPFSAYAEDATSKEFQHSDLNGNITRNGEILFFPTNSTYYYPTVTGGAMAYVPLNYKLDEGNKEKIGKAFFEYLPGSQTGYGESASQAALRYKRYRESGSEYLVKTGAYDYSDVVNGKKWYAPPYNIGDALVSFRYAGMVIDEMEASTDGSVNVRAGTNPDFPSDGIVESSGSGRVEEPQA